MVKSCQTHVDKFGKVRELGSCWLVTHKDMDYYVSTIENSFEKYVDLTVLEFNNYCIIANPLGANNQYRFGKRILIKGPCIFYLNFFEYLECGIQNAYVLESGQCLILVACHDFEDTDSDGKIVVCSILNGY